MTRSEFSITVPPTPFDVPAHGRVTLTIVFRPLDTRSVSGDLQLELDTVAERILRIPLKGRRR
jgi:hypothetical protein